MAFPRKKLNAVASRPSPKRGKGIIAAASAAVLATALLVWACSPNSYIQTKLGLLVGVDGGVIFGPKGSKLIIPVGALPNYTEIFLGEMPGEEIPQLFGEDGRPYERLSMGLLLGPGGLHFNKSIEVQMRYRRAQMTEERQRREVRIFTSPEYRVEWTEIEGWVDVKSQSVRFAVDHFSLFVVFRAPSTAEDGDLDSDRPESPCNCGDWPGVYCPAAVPERIGVSRIVVSPGSDAESEESEDGCGATFSAEFVDGPPIQFQVDDCSDFKAWLTLPDGAECLAERGAAGGFTVTCTAEDMADYAASNCPPAAD